MVTSRARFGLPHSGPGSGGRGLRAAEPEPLTPSVDRHHHPSHPSPVAAGGIRVRPSQLMSLETSS